MDSLVQYTESPCVFQARPAWRRLQIFYSAAVQMLQKGRSMLLKARGRARAVRLHRGAAERPLFIKKRHSTFSGPKPKGSNSPKVISRQSFSLFAMMTRKSGPPNSYSICRHTPQGDVTSASSGAPSFAPTTATAANSCTPSLTALNRAVRSAQLVGVNVAHSMLQPV